MIYTPAFTKYPSLTVVNYLTFGTGSIFTHHRLIDFVYLKIHYITKFIKYEML